MANSNIGASSDIAASNTPNAPNKTFDWLIVVTTAGSVVVDQIGGNTVTLASVPLNVWIPISNGTNIRTTSTAVGFMVV